MNPNLRELRRAVSELGGKILSQRSSGKHFLVELETKSRKKLRMTISKGPMRQGHIQFWVRQKFTRAERNGNHHSRKGIVK